jgi:ATP-dependent DNA helicase RecQ
LYKKGYSIREIAFERNLAEETIANHLIKVMKAGESVILDNLIPQEKQEIILKTADSLNTTRLKPIKERLGDDYSWDEIRLVLAYRERYDLFD